MLSGLYYTLAIKAVEFGENPFVNFAVSGLLEAPACFGTLLVYQFLGKTKNCHKLFKQTNDHLIG